MLRLLHNKHKPLKIKQMSSKNNLSLTGTVVSVADPSAENPRTIFTLVHNFGGKKEPLFIRCLYPEACAPVKKGDNLCIEAYLSPYKGSIQAVIKSISTK